MRNFTLNLVSFNTMKIHLLGKQLLIPLLLVEIAITGVGLSSLAQAAPLPICRNGQKPPRCMPPPPGLNVMKPLDSTNLDQVGQPLYNPDNCQPTSQRQEGCLTSPNLIDPPAEPSVQTPAQPPAPHPISN